MNYPTPSANHKTASNDQSIFRKIKLFVQVLDLIIVQTVKTVSMEEKVNS